MLSRYTLGPTSRNFLKNLLSSVLFAGGVMLVQREVDNVWAWALGYALICSGAQMIVTAMVRQATSDILGIVRHVIEGE